MSTSFFAGKESIGGEIRNKLTAIKMILSSITVVPAEATRMMAEELQYLTDISRLPELRHEPIQSPELKNMKYIYRNVKELR